MKNRPFVATIAGLDPSGGAGLLADIKTFEALQCYGLSVCTANTIQNDTEFLTCYWADIDVVKDQLSVLFKRYTIEYIKIGICENWQALHLIIDSILKHNNKVKIVLDPVLKSSSDFDFHQTSENEDNSGKMSEMYFDQILDNIYLITPNYQEIERLYPDKTIDETIKYISSRTNLLLKGGHRKTKIGRDELYTVDEKQFFLRPKAKNISEKHGSGCVLSSAITAQLALGFNLLKACCRAKRYTERFLGSNKSLLGYHKI